MVNAYPTTPTRKTVAPSPADFRGWQPRIFSEPVPANDNRPTPANDNNRRNLLRVGRGLSFGLRILRRTHPAFRVLDAVQLALLLREMRQSVAGDYKPLGGDWYQVKTCRTDVPVTGWGRIPDLLNTTCFSLQAGGNALADPIPATYRSISMAYRRELFGSWRWDSVTNWHRDANGTGLDYVGRTNRPGSLAVDPRISALASVSPLAIPPNSFVGVPLAPAYRNLPARDAIRNLEPSVREASQSGYNVPGHKRALSASLAEVLEPPLEVLSATFGKRGRPIAQLGPMPPARRMTQSAVYAYKPPKKPVKEKKVVLSSSRIFRLVGKVTEVNDVINAAYYALPRHLQHGYSPQGKLSIIYNNIDRLDPAQFLMNLTGNYVIDKVVGKASRKLHKVLRPVYERLGTPVGIQTYVSAGRRMYEGAEGLGFLPVP